MAKKRAKTSKPKHHQGPPHGIEGEAYFPDYGASGTYLGDASELTWGIKKPGGAGGRTLRAPRALVKNAENSADWSEALGKRRKAKYAENVTSQEYFDRGKVQRSETIWEAAWEGIKNPGGAAGKQMRSPRRLRDSGEISGDFFESGWSGNSINANVYTPAGYDQYFDKRVKAIDKKRRRGQKGTPKR